CQSLRVRRADHLGLALLCELRPSSGRTGCRLVHELRPSAAGRRRLLPELREGRRERGERRAAERRCACGGEARPEARPLGGIAVSVPSPPAGDATEQPNREAFGTAECPRCGTPHEPDQEYCLERGLRLPPEATGVVPRLGSAWRSRVGWYPGDWVWPSLLALVIAALAGIGAAAFVSHDEQRTGYRTRTPPGGARPPTPSPP